MAMSKPPCAFWPLTIATGTNDKMDVYVGGADHVAAVAAGTYYSPTSLAAAVQSALAAAHANDWAVTVSSTGRVTIAGTAAFTFKFGTGASQAIDCAEILGFAASDTASGTSATGAYQHQNGWYPERPCVFDSREEYDRIAAGTIAASGATKAVVFGSPRESRRVEFAWLSEWKTKIDREGARLNEALERLWREGYARFRWWPDATATGTYVDLVLDPDLLRTYAPSRDDRMQLYGYSLRAREYVAP